MHMNTGATRPSTSPVSERGRRKASREPHSHELEAAENCQTASPSEEREAPRHQHGKRNIHRHALENSMVMAAAGCTEHVTALVSGSQCHVEGRKEKKAGSRACPH